MENQVLPSFLNGVRVVGTMDEYWDRMLKENSMISNEKIDIDVDVDQKPLKIMNKQTKELYQSGDTKAIKKFEDKIKSNMEPLLSNMKEHGENAWVEAVDEKSGTHFFMVFNDNAFIWAYPVETVQSNDKNAIKYKHVYQIGSYSNAAGSAATFNMSFKYVSETIIETVLIGILGCLVSKIVKEFVSYSAASITLWLAEEAARKGLAEASFHISMKKLNWISWGLTTVITIGMSFLIAWLISWFDQDYFIQVDIYNFDKTNDWSMIDSYTDNAVISGEKELEKFTLEKKQVPKLPPFIKDVVIIDTVVNYATIVWKNNNTILEGLGAALSLKTVDTDKGFSWALDCPRFKDTKQKAINSIQTDLKSYFGTDDWSKDPLNFVIYVANTKILFTLNNLSGAKDNLYKAVINIGE